MWGMEMKREDKTDPTLTNQPYNGTGNENFSWDNTMIRLTHPVWVSVTPKPKEAGYHAYYKHPVLLLPSGSDKI